LLPANLLSRPGAIATAFRQKGGYLVAAAQRQPGATRYFTAVARRRSNEAAAKYVQRESSVWNHWEASRESGETSFDANRVKR
jgi:hypothetical protein